jgi:hypothetical protein
MAEQTGTDRLRAGIAARVANLAYARLARDLGVAAETLLAFGQGRINLPPEVLVRLAEELWDKVTYDVELDLLRPAERTEARPLGVTAPPYVPAPPSFTTGLPPAQTGYGAAQKSKPEKRQGWLSAWL